MLRRLNQKKVRQQNRIVHMLVGMRFRKMTKGHIFETNASKQYSFSYVCALADCITYFHQVHNIPTAATSGIHLRIVRRVGMLYSKFRVQECSKNKHSSEVDRKPSVMMQTVLGHPPSKVLSRGGHSLPATSLCSGSSQTCMHAYMHTYMQTYTQTCTHAHRHTYRHTDIQTYRQRHVHKHRDTERGHTEMCVCVCARCVCVEPAILLQYASATYSVQVCNLRCCEVPSIPQGLMLLQVLKVRCMQ